MVYFGVFTVLMSMAFFAAIKFHFKDGDEFNRESIKMRHLKLAKDKLVERVKGARGAILKEHRNGENKVTELRVEGQEFDMVAGSTEGDQADSSNVVTRPTPFVPRGTPAQAGGLPEWVSVLRHFGAISFLPSSEYCTIDFTLCCCASQAPT